MINKIDPIIKDYLFSDNLKISAYVHGDPWFSNTMLDVNSNIKFLDMKGDIAGEITTNGDAYLEISSLYSLITPNAESNVSGCTWNGSGTGAGRLRYLSFFSIPEMNSTDYFRNHNTLLLGKLR